MSIDNEDDDRSPIRTTDSLSHRLYEWLSAVGRARALLTDALLRRQRLSRMSHGLTVCTLVSDAVVVLTTLLVLVLRSADAGLGVIDSLPVGLYVLPLMVLLPLVILAYHRTRTVIAPLFVFVPVVVVLGPMSMLVHSFVILMALNLFSLGWVVLVGRLPTTGSIRGGINRRSIAILVVLNLIGLAFPVTTYAMGQLPIHVVSPVGTPEVYLTVDTRSSSLWNTVPLSPNASLVSQIETSGLGLEIVVDMAEPMSRLMLEQWLGLMNTTHIRYIITIDSNRSQSVSHDPVSLGTTSMLQSLFDRHAEGLRGLSAIMNRTGVNRTLGAVQYDLRLSEQEWSLLMERMRLLDVGGVASLFRSTIESIDSTAIEARLIQLVEETHAIGLRCDVLVDALVLDDWLDSDCLFMSACGVTPQALDVVDGVSLACSRTSYSAHMLGDVGEYLVYSYAQSAARAIARGLDCSLRIGVAGDLTGHDGRHTDVYSDIAVLASDVGIISGCGVERVTIESLNSLMTVLGRQAVDTLKTAISAIGPQMINYTFRIYALRAVLMAIDMYDVIMS